MFFADFALQPSAVAVWLALGLAAGWLTNKVREEATYGTIGDVLLGAAGAVVGGSLFGFFVTGEPPFWGAALAALIGASILITVARVISFYRQA